VSGWFAGPGHRVVLCFKGRQQYSVREFKKDVNGQLERLWGRVDSMEHSIEKLEKREDLETQVEQLRQQNIRNSKHNPVPCHRQERDSHLY